MICPYCGATIPDGSEKCRDCGKELRQIAAERTEIAAENLTLEGIDKNFIEDLSQEGAFLGWLVIIEGPDIWKEFHIPVDPGQILVGRGKAADIQLNDESLSRIHLSIKMKGDKFFLVDFDSDSGTKVNGESVERVELHDGDLIQVGRTSIKFKLL